jgi:hypothetical protein
MKVYQKEIDAGISELVIASAVANFDCTTIAAPSKYSHINFSPPDGVKSACKTGLQKHEDGLSGDGLEPATVSWARKYVKGENVSPERARQGNRWFGRNDRFKDEPKDSPAYTAYLLWGGSAGKSWFSKLVEQMDAADSKKSEARPLNDMSLEEIEYLEKSLDSDIMLVRSILVTTNQNKNDDVFLPAEVWKARYTPIHKPTNLNHLGSEKTENHIIGVIVNSYPVDDNLEYVWGEEGDLPEKYHLAVDSHIWKKLFPETAKQIKAKIATGELFVSMEVWFKDFGYALVGKNDPNIRRLIERNEFTSFLSASLRRFGGTGEVNIEGVDYKVGRILKDLTFGGVAIVDTPANPESKFLLGPIEKSEGSFKGVEVEKLLSPSKKSVLFLVDRK